jgi:ABC-type branched-chain amino acid transport systems, ATPase component
MKVLETKDLCIQFGGLTAVSNLNLSIEDGEIVSLIGPNGAGKTTAFNMITGVYTPTSGSVLYRNQEIQGKRPDRITAMGLARTFQNIRLFKEMTVLDNVLVAGDLHYKPKMLTSVLGLPHSRKADKALREEGMALLEEVGLADHHQDIASSLPYGQQRRLEIARALATKPQLLLLDEPAAGMNPRESDDLTVFIEQVRTRHKLAVLLIEHHMQLVMDISDHIYVLEYGNTIAYGKPEHIQNNPAVIKAYLGEEDADA